MHWSIPAITAATSWATADLLSKIAMNRKGYGEHTTLYARFSHSIPFMLIPFFATWPHEVDPLFWLMCLLTIPGDIVASTLYIKALKISPISIVVPLMGFAPVFMLVTSWLMLKEPPNIFGIAGVLMVAAGAYLLNLDRARGGILEPIKAIVKERGPLMVLAAAFIFSIDTAFGKRATQLSDPIFFSLFYCIFMALGYLPLLKREITRENVKMMLSSRILWGIGACFACGVTSFLYAIKVANIAYVSATGKISMLIAIIYGRIFFGETHIRQKIFGALLMITGIYMVLGLT